VDCLSARRQLYTMLRIRHRAKVPIPNILIWLQHPQHRGPFVLTEVSQIDLVLPDFVPLRACRSVPFVGLFLRHQGTWALLLLRGNGLNAVTGEGHHLPGMGEVNAQDHPLW
jgi:hypothetical protein